MAFEYICCPVIRAADCDTEHYLAVVKFTERLVVDKQRSHTFIIKRFNLKKLNKVWSKEQYHVEVSDRFVTMQDLDAEVDINNALEIIIGNIKVSAKESSGYYEIEKHELWFGK
jgi:hypothetical protein